MEIFEYDDVIHHIVRELRMLRKGCYRISIVLAFSRFETIRIRYVRARIFFEDGEKNRRLQKYPDTCTRPQTGILNSLTQLKNNTTGWQCSVAFMAMLFE